MKVLLDEYLPKKLKNLLSGHEVMTVPEAGWAGVKNGSLLRLAEKIFDVFVTIDANLQYQQNLQGFRIAIVELSARDNKLETLSPLMPRVQIALLQIQTGDLVTIQE